MNYSVQEKEALGIIFCVKKFRKMILGSPFKIRCLTDHKSLKCLTNSKEIAGRMARWAMIMSEYHYQVEYIRGVTNTAADGLSRLISLPESTWRPLTLDDSDSDQEHPFLLLWPTAHLLVAAYQHGPSYASAVEDTNPIDVLATYIEENDKWIKKEERLNSLDVDYDSHERVLFSRTTVFTGDITVMTVTKELYPKCQDFGTLYKYLQDRQTNTDSQLATPKQSEELTRPKWGKNGPCTDTRDMVPERATHKRKTQRQLYGIANGDYNLVVDTTVKPTRHRKLHTPITQTKRVRLKDRPSTKKQYTCSDGTTIDLSSLMQRFDVSKYFIDTEHQLLYRINIDDSETLCVPNVATANGEHIRYHLFMEMHDSPFYGHRGATATYNAMRQKFHWSNMREDIAKWIKACAQCQNNKIDRSKPKGHMQAVQVPTHPGQAYNMDFMTDLPKSYYCGMWYDTCWVFVDRCSHRTYTILTRKDHTADTHFDLFMHHLCLKQQNGIPLELIGDRDRTFTAKFFDHALTRLGTNIRLSSARSQQTNGKAERKIATLEEVLRNGVNYRQDNWTEILDYALLALNDAPDPQLGGRSSLYYERGFNPIKPVDIIDTLKIKGSIDTCPTEVKERLKYIQDMRNMVRDAIHEAERSVYHVYYNEKRRDDKSIKVGSLVRLNLDHIGLHLFKRRKSKLNPLW
jgi:transposase InsO family protein